VFHNFGTLQSYGTLEVRHYVLPIDTLYRKIGEVSLLIEEGTVTDDNAPNRDGRSGRGGPGVPRWVKIFAIAAAILVALVVVLLASGHGPGRHGQAAGSSIVRW
jgi:hypothetical protein